MVQVKCIVTELNDLQANVKRKQGDIFEVTEERAKYLNGENPKGIKAVEIIAVVPEKVKTEEKKEISNKKSTKNKKKIDKKK